MVLRFAAVLLVLFFSGLIVSAYEPGTNAERLALGLPPKRPMSFGRIMPNTSASCETLRTVCYNVTLGR